MKKLFALFTVMLMLVSTSIIVFPVKAVSSAAIEFKQPTYAYKGSTRQIEVMVSNTGTETINNLWLGLDLVRKDTKDDETNQWINSVGWEQDLYSFAFPESVDRITVQIMAKFYDGSNVGGYATVRVYWTPTGGSTIQKGNDVIVAQSETSFVVKNLLTNEIIGSSGTLNIKANVITNSIIFSTSLITDWAVVTTEKTVEATKTPIKPPGASGFGGINFDPQEGLTLSPRASRTFTTTYAFSTSQAYAYVYDFGAYYWEMAVWKNGYPGQGGETALTRAQKPFTIPYVFDMTVSIQWNIDPTDTGEKGPSFVNQLVSGLRKASNCLFDATDGQMCFGHITVYDDKEYWENCELRIIDSTDLRPHTVFTLGIWPKVIEMGRQWIDNGFIYFSSWDQDQPTAWGPGLPWKVASRILVHEFGHLKLGLADEYITDPLWGGPFGDWLENRLHMQLGDAECTASLMDDERISTEFCNPANHDPDRDTWQQFVKGMSCWSTIKANPDYHWISIPMQVNPGPYDDVGKDITFDVRAINQGWSFTANDVARTEYHVPATNYRIADQPFQTLWSSPHEGKNLMALTGDVNGDGKLEVVKVSGDNLKVISGTGTGLWTRTIPGVDSYYTTGYLNLNMLEDVTGDGIPEIFVSRKTANTVGRIYVYDGNGNLLKTLTGTVGSDGNMWAVAVFDVNKDGNKEIFCGISSNYVGNPRGACLFDYNTGNQLWYYAAGNAIYDCIADLNNDGKMEITSGWWTVHNGAWGNGKGSNTYTDDSSVYVVTINENGDEMFTWQVHDTHNHGGAFERITDLNKDGTKELLVFHGHEGYYPGYSQIFMLSPTGAILKTFTGSYNANWYQPAIADINNDGKDEVIVGCNDGVLRVFDYNLNVIATSNHNYAPQAVTDLNGDGKLEIVVSDYSTRELVILDNNLNQLWKLSFPVAPTAIVSDVNGDGANELIITADQLYVAANPTTTKEPTPVFDPSVNKISLRYEITPVGTTFKPGTSASVSMYDISKRGQSVLLDLGSRAEDVYIGSFTFDVFKNRDADPKITRDEVVQNFYEALPQSLLQTLSTYISKTHVLYSDLSTVDFLFANFALQILEGTRPQATQAFSVLTFLLPVPLVEPTFVYSQYGYKLAGTWNNLGGGFGTGSLKTVSVYCFADLMVMDSSGRIIDKTTNEIPGAYYFEADLNNDGQLDDTVILPDTSGLEYTIWVVPEPNAPMDSTYTLVLGSADIGIPLAENVMLSDAPIDGYELASLTSPQESPPITTLTIGSPQFTNSSGDLFITSNAPLTLEANPGSADIESTAYVIYNSTYSRSNTCTAPETFYLTGLDDGMYYIDYYSVDTAGNTEHANTRTVNLDNTPPTTNLNIGDPKYVSGRTYVTPDTPFTLTATDAGSGVKLTNYRINSTSYDSGWLTYTNPFNLSSLGDGNCTIAFNSTDNVENVETTHKIDVTLFSWNYVFKDSDGRGTTLKICTAYKFFQFIAPDKDFGVRYAPKMTQLCKQVTITCYEDSQMRLTATAVDDKTCVATVCDKQTGKTYWLIEHPPTYKLTVVCRDSNGKAISGASVYLNGCYKGQTDSNGNFIITNVLAGTYTVTVKKCGYKDSSSTPTVTGDATLTITLTPQTYMLTVCCKDSKGKPVQGASLYLNGVYQGVTDSSGKLIMNNITAGTYTVIAKKNSYTTSSVKVTVTGNTTITITMK